MHGFLGEGSALAQEYHDNDFDFEEHAREMEPLLRSHQACSKQQVDYLAWEAMYQQHSRARFFKERRYLLKEFPHLASTQHVCELGAGCGASILPVLKANPHATATAYDVSATALEQLRLAAGQAGIDASRVTCHTADCTAHMCDQLALVGADTLLIIFTLSAVLPAQQLDMLRNAWAALRPGGLLCIRDHGMYDMVQLRLKQEQVLGPNLYRLQDGTVSYFFTTADLAEKCGAVGFQTVECKYVTVKNVNRKTGVELRRVFVHGVFRKPPDEGVTSLS